MIQTYEELGKWLLENGFRGGKETYCDGTIFKNYAGDKFSRWDGQYRIEKSATTGKACAYSKNNLEILTYERMKQYLIKELKMNDVTPEELEVKPLKSVEPDHVELFKKQLDNAEGIIYQLVEDEGLVDQFFDLRESLLNQESDFEATVDQETYRFIHERSIEEIFKESAIELVKECNHECFNNMPTLLSANIDWDGVVEEVKQNGYGMHFATYDHEEHYKNNYYYFRID